jgi:hypothetical protein
MFSESKEPLVLGSPKFGKNCQLSSKNWQFRVGSFTQFTIKLLQKDFIEALHVV